MHTIISNQFFGLPTILIAITLILGSCNNAETKDKEVERSVESVELTKLESIQFSHIRGLHLVNDEVVWASGANGTYMKCTDGRSWSADTIPGYTHLDFRDIHGFDAKSAVVMAAGSEGRILRTDDGGLTWQEVYADLREGIFLDGIDFHEELGYCYGDPINGKPVILRSTDKGRNWEEVLADSIPVALDKEAGFAASGTGIIVNSTGLSIATGGDSVARIFRHDFASQKWNVIETPMRSGEGCGIFSIVESKNNFVLVGGCYLDSTGTNGNCAISSDQGETWETVSEHQPRGYRSCVAYSRSSDLLISCGRTGIDCSTDQGRTWNGLSNEGYYACVLGDSTGWLMGRRGKMARLNWTVLQ